MNVSVKIVTFLKAIIEKTIHIITYPLKIKKLQKTTKTEQTKREF